MDDERIGKAIIRYIIVKLKKILTTMPFIPKKYNCTLCGSSVTFFLPLGVKSELFQTKNIIGGGYRKKVRCPICGAIDRTRYLDYVLKQKTDIYSNPNNVILHFAPEKAIETKIRKVSGGGYITGDLTYGVADKVVDVTDICYPDNVFDYIIINHVLEHVPNERKAMEEIKRVLKHDGKVVFSMPICEDEDTYESTTELDESERLKQYGQKDHVRLYGRDVKSHMEKYGYNIAEYKAEDILSAEDINNMRLLAKDRIFIGEVKPHSILS